MRSSVELDPAVELRAAAVSGLMALTGRREGPPLHVPGLVAGLEEMAASVARWSAEVGDTVVVDWGELVTARARLLGLRRNGAISANGTCRILRGTDGFMALSLPREDDLAAVGAIVERPAGDDAWEAVGRALAERTVADLVARARLLGVAAATLGPGGGERPDAWYARRCWARSGPRAVRDLSIVDLSSMWAGPLAAMLLAGAGGRVTKVESASRPDGARAAPSFYETLHPADQPVVTVDLGTAEGRRHLRALVDGADVVIESSRPRALEQLGAGPRDVEPKGGRVWVSITGYGREAPGRDWVAFGDDAAVAGGLVAWEDAEHPVFCGDALGDPVAGMVAAAAALEALSTGGGVLLDVSMQACAASLAPAAREPATAAERDRDGWHVVVDGARVPVHDPGARAQPER